MAIAAHDGEFIPKLVDSPSRERLVSLENFWGKTSFAQSGDFVGGILQALKRVLRSESEIMTFDQFGHMPMTRVGRAWVRGDVLIGYGMVSGRVAMTTARLVATTSVITAAAVRTTSAVARTRVRGMPRPVCGSFRAVRSHCRRHPVTCTACRRRHHVGGVTTAAAQRSGRRSTRQGRSRAT